MHPEKEAARKHLRAVRQGLPNRQARSAIIIRNVLSIPEMKNAKTVLSYAPLEGEVDTAGITAPTRSVLYPALTAKQQMIALPASGTWEKGPYGISQPPFNADEMRRANSIDVFIIPGLGFDVRGNRLGYGKGYYDSFLRGSEGIKIGIAFDEQLVDELPSEGHDVPMDYIVTETRVIRCLRK